jgi:hypothetical protein
MEFILVLLMIMTSHVMALGAVCIDYDGLHVTPNETHTCCESESEIHREPVHDCLDLIARGDLFRPSFSRFIPVYASLWTFLPASPDIIPAVAESQRRAPKSLVPTPLAALRCTVLLV